QTNRLVSTDSLNNNMPPHTTLQYTMPSNTTNSKSTSTTSPNGTSHLTSISKPSTTPTPRPRRATSSYVLAPSWFVSNKTGPTATEGRVAREETKAVGSSKKDELGVVKQVKDGNPSLNNFIPTSVNGPVQLTSTRTKTRDFSSLRLKTLEETEGDE
ncbi:9579_t:CDS:2, partial [Acaulospora colombiana]